MKSWLQSFWDKLVEDVVFTKKQVNIGQRATTCVTSRQLPHSSCAAHMDKQVQLV